MISATDHIVSMSYVRRGVLGDESTETVTFVGTPENIATKVATHIQRRLESGGSGPITLHATSRFNVIDADDQA